MPTWDGALYNGPDVSSTRYITCPIGNQSSAIGSGDFSLFMLCKVPYLYTGSTGTNAPGSGFDPSTGSNLTIPLGINSTNMTSGNTSGFWIYPQNYNSPASYSGKLYAYTSISGVNLLNPSAAMIGTTDFPAGSAIMISLVSSGGTITLYSCLLNANAAPVAEATGTRNASWIASFGTWDIGFNSPNVFQTLGLCSIALTTTQIQEIANGTDPDTIVASGKRILLWDFNQAGSSITPKWGSTSATAVGTWSSYQVVGAPLVQDATAYLTLSNEPPVYGMVGMTNAGGETVKTWEGTYVGYAATQLQGQIVNAGTGAVVTAWVNLSSFTASSGTWTGTLSIPVGGPYRIQIRDATTTTIIWLGTAPFYSGAVTCSVGQSPHVMFEQRYEGSGPVLTQTNCFVLRASSGVTQIVPASQANLGSGLAQSMVQWSALTNNAPLLHIDSAVVGTSSTQWAQESSVVWPQLVTGLEAAQPDNMLFQWLNGAADAGFNQSTIESNHTQILANLTTLSASSGATGFSFRYQILPHNRDGSIGADNNGIVRSAQILWAMGQSSFGTQVLLGPWWGDMQLDGESTGTAQGGTSNTITLPATDKQDNAAGYASGYVSIISGTGVGQIISVSSSLTSYNLTTKVLTLASNWATIPDSSSVYVITENPADGTPHPASPATLRFAYQHAQTNAWAWGYQTLDGRGPMPVLANYSNKGQTIIITFQHHQGSNLRTINGGTAATGLAGWEVFSNGTAQTVASAIITSPTQVRLTLSAVPSSTTSLTVRYGWSTPVASAAWDNVQNGGINDLLADDTGVGPNGGSLAYVTTSDLAATAASAAALDQAGFFGGA